jgi:hypothetical protein
VKLLLPSDKASAYKLIGGIDFAVIPDKSYFKLVAYCSDYLTNEEVVQLFTKREIIQPTLHENVVNDEGMHSRNS